MGGGEECLARQALADVDDAVNKTSLYSRSWSLYLFSAVTAAGEANMTGRSLSSHL